MGSFAAFAGPLMRSIHCGVFVRLSILMSCVKRIHELLSGLAKVN